MVNILHIDSSPRAERSHSRELSKEFVSAWRAAHPEDAIAYRDLGHHPVPHVNEAWIAAAFSPPETHTPELAEAIRVSDELVDEFLAADRYVFGVPMYNFNIPSTFKAYIDQIVRINRTVSLDAQGFRGLVEGKKAVIITARGGDFSATSPAVAYDFQEPYLRTIFGFIGITDIQFINANSLNEGDARTQSLAEARAAIQDAIAQW
ncbi:FMN-dependent NADH-azoreductase [Nostoc punctiforme]|uniref:FMN-dependent NADH:quinone oxidoreductase n=1 Tax=Nostoc punctiforme (strain ATCC 29133 / PCC 73102) TaxID=63737 RepID=AZOR_NOSP7|nr:FMN-dependent NADH-azoreductase [Nostoc punctiforme]B2IX28.1 RecName: Full=FMN-dependent NADH:quinone oxidoreductase; AltName: Full=Azo-dye reductase; AltName: Full=FMN-dependent NADH-azo compound oxidoreductase; AltName: Full=FMN-dependent NADH-azoreductase [Nostoc punctiforme PCC 73102]ACC84563.1 NAD(P)H dehydrogenase (quinone) [Nostoc punctiforme PCC 73102]